MRSNILIAAATLAIIILAAPGASAQYAAGSNEHFSYSGSTEASPEIRSFSAVLKNDKAYINWTATDGTGDCIYIIERSTDGISFEKIAVKKGVPSPGDQPLLFSFTDEQPMKNNSIYRVQQITNGITNIKTQAINGNVGMKEDNLVWKK